MQQHAQLGATILVVEDEHLVALDIQRCLERMLYDPVVVYTGEAAVFAVEKVTVDLVLMDIKLPGGLDGIDAATAIRRAHDIPIVYLTAYADSTTLERARATEPYGYVLKPFHERELKAVIEMALHRNEQEHRRAEHRRLERFLYDATAKLGSSLDVSEVARDATELLVPTHVDGCAIHIRDMETLPELTCARPWRNDALPDEIQALIASTERTNRMQGEIAPHSAICVPLAARGHVLGAFATVFNGGKLPDRTFIEGFGTRLGMALDNAMLFRSAQRALELRDDVLAVVSHDLRTPVATILLHAELLGEHASSRRAAEGIKQSALLMNRLIGDLLDASAINAGHLAIDVRVHDVAAIIEDAVQMFRAEAMARGISLVASAQPRKIRCDRERIVQVLANLIKNALKFTPANGTVHVTAIRDHGGVRIDVEDSGAGIPEEQVPKLFDRFWRAEASRDGAGLGLFIARGIVAAHGGSLGVSTAVGQGSRFFFALPEAT